MENELRCDSKLHAILVRAGVVEVKCDSRFCGAERNVIVLHRFDAFTGELLSTKRYREAGTRSERQRQLEEA